MSVVPNHNAMKKTVGAAIVVLLLFLITAAAGFVYFTYTPQPTVPPLSAEPHPGSIRVGDLERTYLLYVPRNLPPHSPLVMVFHGSGEDGADIRWRTGYDFDRLADRFHFALVYPDGYEHNWNDCRRVASYPARRLNINDIGFVISLIDQLHDSVDIDRSRVFAAGHSNGGQFVFRLAFELPDRITAIAAISASLPTPGNTICTPQGKPIPVMIINGTRDPLNPYNGGEVSFYGLGNRGTVISASASAEYFANVDGQDSLPTVIILPHKMKSDPTSIEIKKWHQEGRPEVDLVTMIGGGHVVAQPYVPYPRFLGRTPGDLDAPAEIWAFFARQQPLKAR